MERVAGGFVLECYEVRCLGGGFVSIQFGRGNWDGKYTYLWRMPGWAEDGGEDVAIVVWECESSGNRWVLGETRAHQGGFI